MNPYTVNLVTKSDVEMRDAYENNGNDNYSSDSDGSDYYEEDTRNRTLNWTFTAKSMALQGERIRLCLYHLLEAFNGSDNRNIAIHINRLIPMVFALDDSDPVNISRDEFQNLNFRLQQVKQLRGEGPLEGVNNGFDAMLQSADTKHTVRVQLPIYPQNHGPLFASARPAIVVKYMGFLKFRGRCPASAYGSILRDMMFPARL